ncbi:MAG: hypothetical protein KDK91_00465, partial [Gammaproteobacteria bacterium]|nr:hypothetical protein [Gammaproteobacteria bacterium]
MLAGLSTMPSTYHPGPLVGRDRPGAGLDPALSTPTTLTDTSLRYALSERRSGLISVQTADGDRVTLDMRQSLDLHGRQRQIDARGADGQWQHTTSSSQTRAHSRLDIQVQGDLSESELADLQTLFNTL